MFEEEEFTSRRIVGLGFDGAAATFSELRTGVQACIKKHTPHALFVHCHCHLLQLACEQYFRNSSCLYYSVETLSLLSQASRVSEGGSKCS